jgi:hypothetical protein
MTAIYYATRVQETSSAVGTGSYILGGAITGFRSFANAFTSGQIVSYAASDGTNYEWGVGTYTAGHIARTQILGSSNSNSPVNWVNPVNIFSANLAEMQPFCVCAASQLTAYEGVTWFNNSGYMFNAISITSGSPTIKKFVLS